MAYSTGSGSYTDFMAAVLAHAIADGWTAHGGASNDWPISKGDCRGVDWDTHSFADTDYTLGGTNGITVTEIHLAVGTTPADATAKAVAGRNANNIAVLTNMQYAIDQWHIFSDPANGNYIHAVVQFATPHYPVNFGHMGFGEVDNEGMTHTPLAFAAGSPLRAYAEGSTNQGSPQSTTFSNNGGPYGRYPRPFVGNHRNVYTLINQDQPGLSLLTPGASSPFPANPLWPDPDEVIQLDRVHDAIHPHISATDMEDDYFALGAAGSNPNISPGLAAAVGYTRAQLYSGGVSMDPLPILLLNGTTSITVEAMYLGSLPGVRYASMLSYLPGDSITLGAEEWVLFPMLRQGVLSDMRKDRIVTSGPFAYAYKKVV